ncbi:hypothetical protein HPB49_004533 [Dermacentor silvarum]|uniref:Uncharacterized protein n=1 Tax=Dermacentor silvarum TaxID=543639 RepID=A0ACB8DMY3_DERSI|nr:hypothetical protein HPB49_004533 [Dermacentor silvarum]
MADCYGSLADFADFAGRVHDITEDDVYRYAPPLRPRRRDRRNPREVYNAEFSWRYRFSKQAVLSEMLPLAPKDNERGHRVPALLQLLIALRFYTAPERFSRETSSRLAPFSSSHRPSTRNLHTVSIRVPSLVMTRTPKRRAPSTPCGRDPFLRGLWSRIADLSAAGISKDELSQDTLRPNLQQNIMVASTTRRENADRYVRIKEIRISDKIHEPCSYETAPHSTSKGVIRGIPLQDNPATIDGKIVNQNNPLALAAKIITPTGTVIITFDGHRVPNFVRYGTLLMKCFLYRRQVDVCHACGRLGHRAAVCPTPSDVICRGCGLQNPDEQHHCTPNSRSAVVRTSPRVKNVCIDLRRRTSFADDASSVPDSKSSSPHRRSFHPPIKPHPAQALGAEDARAREADPQVDGAPQVTLPQDCDPRRLLERTPAPEATPSSAPGATPADARKPAARADATPASTNQSLQTVAGVHQSESAKPLAATPDDAADAKAPTPTIVRVLWTLDARDSVSERQCCDTRPTRPTTVGGGSATRIRAGVRTTPPNPTCRPGPLDSADLSAIVC